MNVVGSYPAFQPLGIAELNTVMEHYATVFIRPWSVDSLDGGFFTSQFCPVGRSVGKNKNKILLALIFFLSLTVGVGRSVGRKKIDLKT